MTDRVRFTIAVDADVYEAFADLAHSSGVSLSRCIGDWLRDTAEAAQMTTIKLNAVRKSPQQAFEAFIRDGMLPEMERVLAARRGAAGTRQAARAASDPPSSNTGGKSPGKTRRAA